MRSGRLLPVLVLAAALLSACGGGGSTTAASGSSSTSGASPSAATSGSAASPSLSSAASPSATVTALPDSVLQPIAGMTYERPAGADAAASMQGSAAWLGGYLTRVISLNGQAVGTVQVLRLSDRLPADQASANLSSFLRQYLGGTAAAAQTVAGVQVLVADNVRGTSASVAMFRPDERDVVLLTCAGGSKPTLQMVQLWLQSAGKTR